MSEFINGWGGEGGTMRMPRTVLDYLGSITSNRVKQGLSITSILTTRIEQLSPERWTLMLSGVDRYLGFVFMTTTVIYDRGITFAKKFMESLNYVTNRELGWRA